MKSVPWVVAGALLVLLAQGECAARTSASIEAREDTLAVQRANGDRLRRRRELARVPVTVLRTRWRSFDLDPVAIARGPDSLCVPKTIILTADSLIKADESLQAVTDTLADSEGEHAATAERQAGAYKGLARKPWLSATVGALARLDPAVRLEGELAAGRDWQVVVRGVVEADTAGTQRRLEVGVRRTFRLF